jgi:hypothetical protein
MFQKKDFAVRYSSRPAFVPFSPQPKTPAARKNP